MTGVKLVRWKTPKHMNGVAYIKSINLKDKEETFKYHPKEEVAMIDGIDREKPYFKELVFLDKDMNVLDIDLEEIRNYDYVKEQPKEKKGKIKTEKQKYKEAYDILGEEGAIEPEKEDVKNYPEGIEAKINELLLVDDPIEIELKLKEIKEDYGLSLKTLRLKLEQKRKEIKKRKKDIEGLPSEIDKKFYQEDLLIDIHTEISKDHIQDDREKIGTFIIGASSKLLNPKDHVSVAHTGASSSGKTNIQLSVAKHLPQEKTGIATRITPSEMEDRITDWDLLIVTEINKNREGANTEVVETFKAVMEDGLRIYKKDNITGEPKEIIVPQKSGFYATTETETDEELETRYIKIPVKGSINKNKYVVNSTLEKASDLERLFSGFEEKESWISESIRGLDNEIDVVIPFAKELTKEFETSEGKRALFDYSKERVKRDIKRLLSLTKTIAWLFQKRRALIEREDKKIILAEPTDFLTALKIFTPFFNVSYSGLDPRIDKVFETIKELSGEHSEEIIKEFGVSTTRSQWVIRTELQKKLNIDSVNTIKKYLDVLRDKGLIEVSWSNEHPKFYLINPVNNPVNTLLDPITMTGLTGHLTGEWQGKELYKINGKEKLDDIKLPDFDKFAFSKAESIKIKRENAPQIKKMTGSSLTGSKPKEVSPSLFSEKPCEKCDKPTENTHRDMFLCLDCYNKLEEEFK